VRDAAVLVFAFFTIVLAGLSLYAFFRTDLGPPCARLQQRSDDPCPRRQRGQHDRPRLACPTLDRAGGRAPRAVPGFCGLQMGSVWSCGLASVIIGEALVGTQQLGLVIVVRSWARCFSAADCHRLRAGLNPNDLKLITAAFVFVALVLPNLLNTVRRKRPGAEHA